MDNPNFYFDSEIVTKFFSFTKVCPHVKGHLRSTPIELEPCQQFLFANLLGFKHVKTGLRKYRSGYVQVPRKNAKSTTAAILTNWFLVMVKGHKTSIRQLLAVTKLELCLMT